MPSETIPQLAARLGRTRATVWRWIVKGIDLDGRRVKLAATRVGACWTVSPEQWAKFEADCNPDAKPLPESPAAYKRRAEAARRAALSALGGAS